MDKNVYNYKLALSLNLERIVYQNYFHNVIHKEGVHLEFHHYQLMLLYWQA